MVAFRDPTVSADESPVIDRRRADRPKLIFRRALDSDDSVTGSASDDTAGSTRGGTALSPGTLANVAVVALLAAATLLVPFLRFDSGDYTTTGTVVELSTQLYEVTVGGIITPDAPGLGGVFASLIIPVTFGLVTIVVVMVCWFLFVLCLALTPASMLGIVGRDDTLRLSALALGAALFALYVPGIGAGVTPEPRLGFWLYAGAFGLSYLASEGLPRPTLGGVRSGGGASPTTARGRYVRRRRLATYATLVGGACWVGAGSMLPPDPSVTAESAVVVLFVLASLATTYVVYATVQVWRRSG